MSETKDTVSVTIDDRTVQVSPDATIFQAAEKAGIFVPHYCYHPDLSIAGVCRMCLVEIDKVPKLQIACNTPVREGMVVRTSSEKAREAQKGSLELHLINHPLDCPICDKAGECKLQDFYRDFGLYQSRMELENKVHKPKVVDIGTIVLDSERCILCSRCVRFTDEVTKTNELVFMNRGDRTVLQTYDQEPLRNDYTGNLADICPVGALTAKDFRFQQRVWFLRKKDSVCTLCARGCNTNVSYNPKTKTLYRVEPRRNVEVNKSWICDTGRWKYHYVYAPTRVQTPQWRGEAGLSETTWEYVFKQMKRALDESSESILVGLSTQLTNEEIADLAGTLTQAGVKNIGWLVDESVVEEREPWDGVLKHRDHTPNAWGTESVLKAMGVKMLRAEEMIALSKKTPPSAVWLFGLEGEELPWVGRLVESLPASVPLWVHATSFSPQWERASVVLPNTSAYEKTGTLVNALGRLQRLQAAIPRVFISRDGHAVALGMQRGHDRDLVAERRCEDLFEKIVSPAVLGRAASWDDVGPLGVPAGGTK